MRNVSPPLITGSTSAFSTLTASSGTWSPSSGVTFTFAWLRCDSSGATCLPIVGATQSTYVLELSELGSTVRVRVTGSLGTQQVVVDSLASSVVSPPSCTNALTIGPLSPATVTTSPGMVPWTSPSAALVDDGTSATVSLRPGESAEALEISGLGVTLPANAVILGVQVQVRHQASLAGAVVEHSAQFVNASGNVSTNVASSTAWPNGSAVSTFGGPTTNLFGGNELSVINAPDFRFRLLIRNSSTTGTVVASIDSVIITVHTAIATVAGPFLPAGLTPSGSGVPWTSLSNVTAVDGAFASATLAPTQVSQRVRTSAHAVSLPPSTAPSGIIVRIHHRTTAGTGLINDGEVRLVKAGVIVGLTRPSSSSWPANTEIATYGSILDLWGSSWLASDVTNSGFGLSFIAQNPGSTATGPATAQVDAIEVFVAHSPMNVSTALTPSTAASTSTSIAWMNVANAAQLDGMMAVAPALTFPTVSDLLRTGGYGFSVPSSAYVTGVTLESRRRSLSNGGLFEAPVRLVVGGLPSNQNRSPGLWWPSTLTALTIGGPSDLWGRAGLTPAQVNAATFGVEFGVAYDSVSGNDWGEVDAVRLSVTYCPHP